VSLSKALDADILYYEQGEPTNKAHVTSAVRKVAPSVGIVETKRPASEMALVCGKQETTLVLTCTEGKLPQSLLMKILVDPRSECFWAY
jgi:hypothetical protein